MARKPRIEIAGGLYHIITRGNNRRRIFRSHDDYLKFLLFLELNDEMRSVYGDVLSEQKSTLSALASLDVMEGQSRAPSRIRQTI